MKRSFAMFAVLALAVSAVQIRADDSTEDKIQKYFELATAGKDEAEAKKLGDAVLAAEKDNANLLNDFAWKILTDEGIAKRDMEMAMKIAKAAFDACKGEEAHIVDTYARALFDTGKREDGIKWQKKAIELCQDDNLKNELEETLKRYEKTVAEKKDTEKKDVK